MKYVFNLSLFFYLLSYLLPFVDRLSGYEVEFEMWHSIFADNIPDTDLATIWSIRWMVTTFLLVLYWSRVPEIHRWLSLYTDKSLLNRGLVLVLTFLVTYPFLFEQMNWQWGSIAWASLAIVTGIIYLITEYPPAPTQTFHSLEQHLVELEED